MNKMLVKLKNMFCYCGATKEQYNSIKKDAYISNFVLWKSLNIVMVILFAIGLGTGFTSQVSTMTIIFRGLALVYSISISFMFLEVLKQDSLAAQIIIYVSR